MKYEFTDEQLKLNCINISEEIIKDDDFLNDKNVTVFNSSILKIKNTNKLLIASRGWYGDVRTWEGYNFVVLSVFSDKLEKLEQNILEVNFEAESINTDLTKKKIKEIIPHDQKKDLKGPEDPRLFYFKGDIYILVNELNYSKKTSKKPRHMFLSKIDLDTLSYDEEKDILCEKLSKNFEKNWGSFKYKNDLYMLYDINPLTIFKVKKNFDCKSICEKKDKYIEEIDNSFPDLKFHLRNSTNLIKLKGTNNFLGVGHAVLDYKDNTEINKYIISLIDESEYSTRDKSYFKKFFKLYTAFFYVLDMDKKEITSLSPFFQLPNNESKQELIFFPTSIFLDKDNYVNISYNVGDNRSYFLKIHLNIIKISLYKKENINFLVNHNINLNFYLELVRNIRKVLGFSVNKLDYYGFKKQKSNTKHKKRHSKRTKRK